MIFPLLVLVLFTFVVGFLGIPFCFLYGFWSRQPMTNC